MTPITIQISHATAMILGSRGCSGWGRLGFQVRWMMTVRKPYPSDVSDGEWALVTPCQSVSLES